MNLNEGNNFTIFDFDDNLEQSVILPLIDETKRQAKLKDGSINLWINSYGGYRHLVFQIISLVEMAKRNGVVVRTIVNDIAYSAGSILAVTGSPGERYIERTAEHLCHYGFTGSNESTPAQVERNYAQKNEGFKKILNHYKKYTDIPDIEMAMNDDSFYIPAAKCIRYGLADKYLDKLELEKL